MSGEEGEEPRPANIYIHGLISIVREGDQGAAWLECGKLGLGEGDNVESLSHTHTHTHTPPPGPAWVTVSFLRSCPQLTIHASL